MLSTVCLALTMLTGSVGLEIAAADGLDPAGRQAFAAELDYAIAAAIGERPSPGRLTLLARGRRVGSRVQVSIERREGREVVAAETIDLTRDPRSWRSPLLDVVMRLLPEGRALATHPSGTPAVPPPAAPVSPTVAPPMAPAAPARHLAPPVSPVARQAAAPPTREPPALRPDPVDASSVPLIVAAPAEPHTRSKLVPLLAMGAGVACAIGGVNFVMNASDAIDAASFSIDREVLEAQQRSVFENAVLGSVLLSVGAAATVTGLLLLVGD